MLYVGLSRKLQHVCQKSPGEIMMGSMKPSGKNNPDAPKIWPLWLSISVLIVGVFGVVTLFGLIVYGFSRGAARLGLSTTAQVALLVIISGVFAWLVKRLTDIVVEVSRYWFALDNEQEASDDVES